MVGKKWRRISRDVLATDLIGICIRDMAGRFVVFTNLSTLLLYVSDGGQRHSCASAFSCEL